MDLEFVLEQDLTNVRSEVVGVEVVLRTVDGDLEATFSLDEGVHAAIAAELGVAAGGLTVDFQGVAIQNDGTSFRGDSPSPPQSHPSLLP